MSTDVTDLRSTIIPKSDQLNTDQLLGGPLVITVTDVRAGGGDDQPVSIFHDTDPARPYKPCKTMRKVLIHAWGPNGRAWVGKSMELYAEPSVKFGGELVGGIRIARLTDIPKDIKVSLTATKGRKTMHEIGRLELSGPLQVVLQAIAAANDKKSMDAAKAKAKELKSPADAEIALAAYKKRVEALKEKAAATSTPTDRPDTGAQPRESSAPTGDAPEHPTATGTTYAKLAERINKAASRDDADLVLDEARALPADQQADLQRLADDKLPQ